MDFGARARKTGKQNLSMTAVLNLPFFYELSVVKCVKWSTAVREGWNTKGEIDNRVEIEKGKMEIRELLFQNSRVCVLRCSFFARIILTKGTFFKV